LTQNATQIVLQFHAYGVWSHRKCIQCLFV